MAVTMVVVGSNWSQPVRTVLELRPVENRLELTPSSPVSVGYFLSVVGTGSGSGLSKNSKKTRPDQTLKHY
jgi:hypothetical protein